MKNAFKTVSAKLITIMQNFTKTLQALNAGINSFKKIKQEIYKSCDVGMCTNIHKSGQSIINAIHQS